MTQLLRPEVWRGLSTVALVAGIVGLVLGATWGWAALIASGALWAVELGVLARRRSATPRA
jgi:hypothetical protein